MRQRVSSSAATSASRTWLIGSCGTTPSMPTSTPDGSPYARDHDRNLGRTRADVSGCVWHRRRACLCASALLGPARVGARIPLESSFFFQAEDGIRAKLVTGVQTCALPIYARRGEVYAAVYGADGAPLAPETVAKPAALAEILAAGTRIVAGEGAEPAAAELAALRDRKSTRLNSSH